MSEKKFSDMSQAERMEDLKLRVQQFQLLDLPGQPQGMHMGTSYLVRDLWRELQRVASEKYTNPSLDEALNSGDGTYRP